MTSFSRVKLNPRRKLNRTLEKRLERRRRKGRKAPRHDTRRPKNTNTITRSTITGMGVRRELRLLLHQVIERNIDITTNPQGMEGRLALVGHWLRRWESTIRFRMIYYIFVVIFVCFWLTPLIVLYHFQFNCACVLGQGSLWCALNRTFP